MESNNDTLDDVMMNLQGAESGHKEAVKALFDLKTDDKGKSDIDLKTDLVSLKEINGFSALQTLGRVAKFKMRGKKIISNHDDLDNIFDEWMDNQKRLRVSKSRMGRNEVVSVVAPMPQMMMPMQQEPRRGGFFGNLFRRRE